MRTRLAILISTVMGLLLTFTWVRADRWSGPAGTAVPKDVNAIHLHLSFYDPVLDPALAFRPHSFFVINQLFLGLVRKDDVSGEALPGLASSWEVSQNADVFTFTLRSDAVWTDGNPVTPEDVREGILRNLALWPSSSFASYLWVIQDAEAYSNGEITPEEMSGITVIDESRIEFALTQPGAYFLSLLAMPVARPTPSEVIDLYGSSWTEPENIVTNGAYRLAAWNHGNSLTLTKNPDYHDASGVQYDQVQLSLVDDFDAWSMYLSGDLDSAIVPTDFWSQAGQDPDLEHELHRAVLHCTRFLGFNTSKPPFDDVKVRKAFIASVNRQGLIDDGLGYAQQAAFTLAPPGVFGHVDGFAEGIGIPYDPAQAADWLADSSYGGAAGLPPITAVFNDDTEYQDALAYIRGNWLANLGVNVTLTGMDFPDYWNLLNSDPPQIWQASWCSRFADAYNHHYDFVIANNSFFGEWNEGTYLNFLNQVAQATDPNASRALYRSAEEILVEEDATLFPLYYAAFGVATQPHLVRTYSNGGFGGYISDWYPAFGLFLPLVTAP